MKTCAKCKERKELSAFPKRKGCSGGFSPRCRACMRLVWNARFKDNPLELKNKILLREFGINLETYQAMHKKQDGRCMICGESETALSCRKNRTRDLSVDHCHESGKIRGLLCSKCNIGLGNFRDDILLLGRAMEYLATAGV